MIPSVSPSCWILAIFDSIWGRKFLDHNSISQSWNSHFNWQSIDWIISGNFRRISSRVSRRMRNTETPNNFELKPFGIIHRWHGSLPPFGIWFHWRTIALTAGVICLVALVSILNMTESPIWLLKHKKFKKSVEPWVYYRGTDDLKSMCVIRPNESAQVYSQKNK